MAAPKAKYITLVYENGVVVNVQVHDTKKAALTWTQFWVDKNKLQKGSSDRIEVWNAGKAMVASTAEGGFA